MGMELYHRSMLTQFQSPFGACMKRRPLALHRRMEVVDTPGAHSNVTPTQYEDSFVVDDDEEEEEEEEEDEFVGRDCRQGPTKKKTTILPSKKKTTTKRKPTSKADTTRHKKTKEGNTKPMQRRGAVLQLSASSESREQGDDNDDDQEEEEDDAHRGHNAHRGGDDEGWPTGLTLEHEDVCRECGREDDRELLLCDGCPVAVHLRCVGLWKVPKGIVGVFVCFVYGVVC